MYIMLSYLKRILPNQSNSLTAFKSLQVRSEKFEPEIKSNPNKEFQIIP